MDRPIRRLPEIVINRVAAGEVVERPSAVVKELVENAIDAGASEIRVDFRRAGKDFISVEDNGSAMSRENALLAVERHATSKIFAFEDLSAIGSFGFRGEALPSIASVSHFTLRTRRMADELGTEIAIDDGVQTAVRSCVMAPGTAIRVEHLFQSVPARRKFLKTDQTEANHIIETVRAFALAFPSIAFRLRHGDRVQFVVGGGTRGDRIRQLWGDSVADVLQSFQEEEDGRRLSGFIARPGLFSVWSAPEMLFFANGRAIVSKDLKTWATEACAPFFFNCEAVHCFLFLELPADQMDVNVHPAKREVRFADRGALRNFILRSMEKCLSSLCNFTCSAPAAVQNPTAQDLHGEDGTENNNFTEDGEAAAVRGPERTKLPALPMANELDRTEEGRPPALGELISPWSCGAVNWRYIGLLDSHCALFASETGLIFFDLRAAANYLAREKVRTAMENPQRQKLLVPITLDLHHWEIEDEEGRLEELRHAEFSVERTAPRQFTVGEIPQWLDKRCGEAFLCNWLRAEKNEKKTGRSLLTEAAARHTIRTQTPADEPKIKELLNNFLQSNPSADSLTSACFEISQTEIHNRRRAADP
jgi:DNA mismatch repair protein MutL